MTGFFEGRGNPHTTVTPHELSEHQDVTITSPIQGDTLQYESETDTWVNRPIEALTDNGHIIADATESYPQRQTLIFEGSGVAVSDNSPLNATNVLIDYPPTVGYPDLLPAGTLDGTELVAIAQGEDGVKTTTQDIAGDPFAMKRGHGKNRLRQYTTFEKTSPSFTSTNATICGGENFIAFQNGSGAQVAQAVALGVSGFILFTGTTSSGRAAVRSTDFPIVFNTARSMDLRVAYSSNALPSVEAYDAYIGFLNTFEGSVGSGMFFKLDAGNTQWRGEVLKSGTTQKFTGVVETTANLKTYRVFYDAEALATKFYIGGALVATVLNSERVLTNGDLLGVGVLLIKSSGTTSASIGLSEYWHDIETAPSSLA